MKSLLIMVLLILVPHFAYAGLGEGDDRNCSSTGQNTKDVSEKVKAKLVESLKKKKFAKGLDLRNLEVSLTEKSTRDGREYPYKVALLKNPRGHTYFRRYDPKYPEAALPTSTVDEEVVGDFEYLGYYVSAIVKDKSGQPFQLMFDQGQEFFLRAYWNSCKGAVAVVPQKSGEAIGFSDLTKSVAAKRLTPLSGAGTSDQDLTTTK